MDIDPPNDGSITYKFNVHGRLMVRARGQRFIRTDANNLSVRQRNGGSIFDDA
jgi:hypothetical protein